MNCRNLHDQLLRRTSRWWNALFAIAVAVFLSMPNAQAQTFVIGAGAITTTSTGNDPIDGYYNAMRHQVVYLASELSTGGMSAGDNLSGLGWSIAGDYAGGNLGNYTISIGHTAATNCAAHVADALTVVKNPFAYNPTVTAAGVFDMIPFDTQFMWNGTSNIVVDICTGTANPYTGPYGQVRADTYTTGSRFKRADGGGSQCALNTTTTNPNRPQVQFSYVGGSACSGTPTPGNTLSSVAIACSGVNFTLSLQNATTGTGVTYQWESADDAGFTVNQANLGIGSTQIINQASAKWYRCTVSCFGAIPPDGISTPVQVGLNPSACECGAYAAIYATYSGDEDITTVTVGSMTNNNACNVAAPGAGSVASQYSNFTGIVVGPSEDQGASVAFSVGQGTLCGGSYTNIVQIYVDWNQDGVFNDTDERVFNQAVGVSGVNVPAGNFTVPVGAPLGTTRMRLVVIESGSPATNYAQTGYGWGETEDYCFTVTASSACSGTPAPGNTLATVATACTGVNFTLSLQNQTLGSGVTYQWESADDAGFTVNVAALGMLSTQVTNQASAKWYRCTVSCFGAIPPDGISAPVQVGLNASACECGTYSSIFASSAADEDITEVTVGSMTNNNACGALALGAGSIASRYSNYTGSVVGPSADQGAPVAFSVGQGSLCGGSYTNIVQIYVDWDQNGVFNNTDERVFAQAAGVVGVNVQAGNFTVPVGAPLGTTRMRLVINETSTVATNWAETGYTWGETEDYCFTVTLPPPCGGQPTPGNTLATVATACPSVNFTLSLQNATLGSGVTYLWESADDAAFTVNVASLGASNTQVTNQTSAKYYRCTVSCPSNPDGVSNYFFMDMGSGCQCNTYCTATNAGGSCITNVSVGGLNNTTAGCSGGNYSLQSASTTLYQNTIYSFSMTNDASAITSVWFDWDNDGTFTAAEWYQVYLTGTAGSVNVSVPVTFLGQIRMRVRSRGAGNLNGSGDACTVMGGGETEDYCITIAPEPACPIPGGVTVAATSSTTASVSWTGTGSFIVEYGDATSFTIPGSDNTSGPELMSTVVTGASSPYVIPGLVHPNQYRVFVRKDCTAEPNGYSPNSNGVLFYPQPPYDQCQSIVSIPTLAASNVLVLNGNNFGATDIEGFGANVSWEAFTLTECVQTLNIDYCGSTPARTNAFINLFLGCPQSAGFIAWEGIGPTCPNGSVNLSYLNVPAGTYYIAVMSQAGAIGPYGINVTAGAACPPAPPNDLCMNATPIACGQTITAQTTVNATRTGAPADICNGFLNNSSLGVWYSATGLCGSVTASLCTTLPSWNSKLAVYSGSCGAGLVCVTTNDQFCGDLSQVTWPAVANETYYLYVLGAAMANTGTFDLSLACVNTPVDATSNVINDLCAGTFDVEVVIANTGGSPATINWVATPGGPGAMGPIPAGTYNLTGFAQNAGVEVSVTNGISGCDLNLGGHYSNCPVTLICGNPPVIVNHCYKNGDTRTFTFTSNTPGETVRVTFIQGSMDPGDVIRAYNGTDNTGQPIAALTGPFVNLAGVFGDTDAGYPNYESMYIEIDSDVSNSCHDGGQGTPWIFQAQCTPGCVPPTANVTPGINCGAYTFTLTVDITYTGDAATTDLSYTVNAGTPIVVPGLVDGSTPPYIPSQVILGPYPIGTIIDIDLLHGNDPGCDVIVGSYQPGLACPPPGTSCGLPLDVSTFPYNHVNTTCGMGNNVGGPQCGLAANYGGGEDFIYRLNISTAGDYQISAQLTGGSSFAGWFLKNSASCNVTASCIANAITTVANGNASGIVTLAVGTYYLIIDSRPLPNCVGYTLNIQQYVPLPGESCANAIVIPTVPTSVNGSTVAYISNYDAVCPYNSPGGKDVVYSYTAVANETLQLTMCTGTTNYDTKLYVYATTCTGTVIACNDDACANPPLYASSFVSSIPSLPVTAGTTYYFVVDAYSTGDQGDYTLQIGVAAPPPANDLCTTPVVLTVNTAANCPGNAVTGDNTLATQDGITPPCDGGGPWPDLWYTFNAGLNTVVNIDFTNISMSDIVMEVIQTNCAGVNLSCAFGGGDLLGFAVTPGEDYYIRVSNNAGFAGGGQFSLCVSQPPPPPVNDDCGNAIPLTCNGGATAGYTSGATAEVPDPGFCGTSITTPGVWYTVTAPLWNGGMTASLCGSAYDTKLSVYTGACGAWTCVTGNDDASTGPCAFSAQSYVSWASTAGTTYYILVHGFGGQTGNFTIEVTCGDNNPACPNNGLTLEFDTDDYGYETSWEIVPEGMNTPACAGPAGSFPSNALGVLDQCCLPDGCYRLRVLDDFGDGMSTGADGGYILRTQGTNQRIIDNRNNFLNGAVSAIANNEGFCLPIGYDYMIYTSCDKLDWNVGPCDGSGPSAYRSEFIVADINAAVTAAYGVSNSNTGFQFWFFNPNGAYSFRRLRNHAQGEGAPVTANNRYTHCLLNNWAAANHLQDNILYNVRVRPVMSGNYGEFGPACRMMLSQAAAQCPVTKLMDVPFNPFLSCGEHRLWGTGNYVHARPVWRYNNNCVKVNANRYRFRFFQTSEPYDVTVTSSTYFRQLNWAIGAGAPLADGETYEVTVEASFNNGASYCPVGDVCLVTIDIPPPFQGGGNQNMVLDNSTGLRMYPNPNRGDQLYLGLDAIEEGVQTVSVDIYDLFGKRVSARTIAVQDGFINTVLELNDMAAGMYLVNITAGESTFSERLVIQP